MVCNGLIKVNLIDDTSKINVKMIDNSSKIDVKLTDYNDKGIRDDIEELRQTKVDKIEGKGLSTNDYTNEEKEKLSTLENYDDSEVRELIDTKQPRGNYLTEETDPTVPNHVKNITQNDITSWDNKADISDIPDVSDKQDITDNSLTTINKTIPSAINEVNDIAKGANQAVGYNSYSDMITAINAMDDEEFLMGQNIYVVTVEVPDLWVSSVESTSSTYTYVDDATFVSALETNGYVQVGYYKLSMLETQKVDLTNYVTNTDYANGSNAGIIKTGNGVNLNSGHNLQAPEKTYTEYQQSGTNTFIGKGTLENVIAGKGLGTYSKPSGGIPNTDMTSAVQTSLGKADGSVQLNGGSAQQTIQLTSGTGTTPLGVKSNSTGGSYISFSNTGGWLGSYGVGADKKPTYYNGTGYTIAYTSDIPTKTSQLTNNSNFVSDASYIHTDNNYTSSDKTRVNNLQSSLVMVNSPTPNFDGMIPLGIYEFDVTDTSYHPIYTLPNTGLSFTNFSATVGYRITVTGTNIEQIVDIIDEWYNPASYPLTTAINRTLSTSSATTGFRYLRAVYPTSTYINDTDYPLGQEIACYNANARHFKIEVFRQPSNITWKLTADTSIYVDSTHNGNSSATVYSTRGWIYRSPASFVASSASSATYASGYEEATIGVGSLKTGATAISASHLAYLADDNLVYDISNTKKNMAPGFTKIGAITTAVAKNTAISATYFRSATTLSSTIMGTISHDTLALGKRLFLRCTKDANGNIHSDNYIATTMGAGYTWMPIGVATSSSAGYLDARSQHFYTLDANGKLTHIDGLEIVASS